MLASLRSGCSLSIGTVVTIFGIRTQRPQSTEPGKEAGSRPPVRSGTSGEKTAFPADARSELINTAKTPGKETRPVAGRKQLIDERRAGGRRDLTRPCRTYGTNHKTGHKRVQRFPAGGFPSRRGGC